MQKIKFKKLHKDAVAPTRATDGSAGFDLTAVSVVFNGEHLVYEVDTGIAVEIPKGYVGLVVPRSSIYETGFLLCNSCGIIDSDYRGAISFKFYTTGWRRSQYYIGDRIGQLVVVPCLLEMEEADSLPDTERGAGGYGSTGQ
jgi:dUTP pyrophosphatase